MEEMWVGWDNANIANDDVQFKEYITAFSLVDDALYALTIPIGLGVSAGRGMKSSMGVTDVSALESYPDLNLFLLKEDR